MNLTNISWLKVSMPRCARAPARMQVGTTAAGMTARPRLNTGTKVLLKLPQQITRPRARPMPRTGELSCFSSEVRVPTVYPAAPFRLTHGT
jgi:hypothetical protein